MGILGLHITVCTTETRFCSPGLKLHNTWFPGQHQEAPCQGIATCGNLSLFLLCTYMLLTGYPFAFNKSLQWQNWNRLLALWQPGYCQEELGSTCRCYDVGSLLKGKNIEGKLEKKQRVRGNVRKVQEIKVVAVNTWKLFEVYVLRALGDWRHSQELLQWYSFINLHNNLSVGIWWNYKYSFTKLGSVSVSCTPYEYSVQWILPKLCWS